MATRDELHRAVDTVSERDTADVLEYVQWLAERPEALTRGEVARVSHGDEQVARGEYVTLDGLRRDLGL